MEKITFTFEDTNETVDFFVLEQTKLNGATYLLVADNESDDAECLILKETESGNEQDNLYDIVEDDNELTAVSKVIEELLEDVIIENKQAMEMTDIYHNILRSTMSLFGSIIDNNLNQVMKFLAAITIILELPTMISGLYGMNVNGVGMPFATKAYGFAAISIFSLIVCLIAVYILKKKHIL